MFRFLWQRKAKRELTDDMAFRVVTLRIIVDNRSPLASHIEEMAAGYLARILRLNAVIAIEETPDTPYHGTLLDAVMRQNQNVAKWPEYFSVKQPQG